MDAACGVGKGLRRILALKFGSLPFRNVGIDKDMRQLVGRHSSLCAQRCILRHLDGRWLTSGSRSHLRALRRPWHASARLRASCGICHRLLPHQSSRNPIGIALPARP